MACLRNGQKHRVLFLNHMAATISMSREMLPVELQAVLPHGGTGSYFHYCQRSYSLTSCVRARNAAPTEVKQPAPRGGQGCHHSPGAQGTATGPPSSTLCLARPRECRSSAGHPPGLTITLDKRHLTCIATVIMAQPLGRTAQRTLTATASG